MARAARRSSTKPLDDAAWRRRGLEAERPAGREDGMHRAAALFTEHHASPRPAGAGARSALGASRGPAQRSSGRMKMPDADIATRARIACEVKSTGSQASIGARSARRSAAVGATRAVHLAAARGSRGSRGRASIPRFADAPSRGRGAGPEAAGSFRLGARRAALGWCVRARIGRTREWPAEACAPGPRPRSSAWTSIAASPG